MTYAATTTRPTPTGDATRMTEALEFITPERPQRVRTMFRVDGEEMYAVEPKGGQLMALARAATAAQASDDQLAQLGLIDDFMDLCLEPETAERLNTRLEDPEDNFDVDDLTKVINALQGAWTKRPTGRPSGSSRQRRPTGKASTARARSKA